MKMTFRRYYVDQCLANTSFNGNVLDIGGKKIKKRGAFSPPEKGIRTWKYLNTDQATSPDYLCSAEKVPVEDETFDVVLMSEVLEHLENPAVVLKEANRILKKGGKLVMTTPFLFPIHADPHDFQRWVPSKIEIELKRANFTVETIEPMGSLFAVLYDLLYVSLGAASKNRHSYKNRIISKYGMPVLAKIVERLDRLFMYKANKITTGFYVVGGK